MKTILIIEDDMEMAEKIKEQVEKEGFSAEIISDGGLVVDKVKGAKPNLIILDILLPRMNGFKLARLLKFSEDTKHIPVIIISVRKEKADMAMAASMGVDAYFSKPFVMAEVVSTVKHLLAKS